MHAKVLALALLPVVAVTVSAAPLEAREPGFFDDIANGAKSLFGEATSKAESVIGSATSAFHAGEAEFTATSLFNQATSILGTSTSQVYATVTSISGAPVVEVTSVGGPVITLATGSGTATSFAGHVFTAAPAPSSSSSSSSSTSSSASASATHKNAATSSYGMTVSKPMLITVAGVIGSMFAGALTVL